MFCIWTIDRPTFMDVWSLLLIVIAASAAAGVTWCAAAVRLRAATAEILAHKERIGKTEGDLLAARHEANFWRTQAETEAKARAVAETAAARTAQLETDCTGLREQLMSSTATLSRLETRLAEQEQAHCEKIATLTELRGEIEREMKNIASESLRGNQTTFLQLANEVFDRHREGAAAELESRRKEVEGLVSPMHDTLEACRRNLAQLEKMGAETYGALSSELKNVVEAQNGVRTETTRLVTALRAAPKTRGRWGEHTLRNVIELAGLNSYSDFAVEQSYFRDGGQSRPDLVIRLPGGRSIVIDAKTPMAAYLDAVDAVDEHERDRHLSTHAQQMRAQVKLLAAKSYWDGLAQTPDYVVMFVPGENFYAAAAERDPDLFEFAAAQRVLIVTPTTLIALAKAVAYGWRQEKVAENANRVHELGRDLYRRLAAMGGHVTGLGKALEASVRKYNECVGSLESSVMPQARRFHELEVEGAINELAELRPIEIEPRQLRAELDAKLPLLAGETMPV
jgi:DNA recombination protein RmuC